MLSGFELSEVTFKMLVLTTVLLTFTNSNSCRILIGLDFKMIHDEERLKHCNPFDLGSNEAVAFRTKQMNLLVRFY